MVAELIANVEPAPARDASPEELYEQAFPPVARFVSKMGGTFADAKDIFHDALVIYYEKMTEDHFEVTSTPQAYILGIAKHLWLAKFKDDRGKIKLDDLPANISIPADYYAPKSYQRLLRMLELTGQRCLELLRAFYYDKRSMNDIADTFGYSNVRTATVQKFKCLEKIRNTIKQKSITYEDLAE
jgi:RNA polymerase sigma factor (sigma-70 family)